MEALRGTLRDEQCATAAFLLAWIRCIMTPFQVAFLLVQVRSLEQVGGVTLWAHSHCTKPRFRLRCARQVCIGFDSSSGCCVQASFDFLPMRPRTEANHLRYVCDSRAEASAVVED